MNHRGRHLAQCARGLEKVLADELRQLGGTAVEPVAGGVLFDADRRVAARAVLWLRSAVRVLEPVTSGRIASPEDLYELVAGAPWEELVGPDRSLAVRASLAGGPMADRRYAALKVKDAIVDRVRARRGRRPNVDRQAPDVPIRLVVRGATAHLFRDLAGDSLHRRGYRPVQVKSPLPEAVAAGLLLLTGWTGEAPLLDPMCGSGTFLIEAASLAADRAPGADRRFAAERFPDADPRLWRELRQEARDRQRRTPPCPLAGSDRHPGAVEIARRSAQTAGFGSWIRFEVADAGSAEPPFLPGVVVSNPPWGGRLAGQEAHPEAAWRSLGGFLRRCPGAVAWVLSGDPGLTRHLGLRSSGRWPVRIARFDARWLRYELRGPRPSAAGD